MGCTSSKHLAHSTISPLHHSSLTHHNHNHNHNNQELLEKIKDATEDDNNTTNDEDSGTKRSNVAEPLNHHNSDSNYDNKHSKKAGYTPDLRRGKSAVAKHVAAGWPAWLSAAAGEAIDGWVPLKSDCFERFEKIGKGTYSNVYRARDLRTGKMMALKKVKFDNFQPESVRFMAREITILRKLDHPNIMKLEGIITSPLSCSLYLVFEYMEHDLAGLLSSPNIKFDDPQIKCYTRQLLKGIKHCHSRGIIHRDIKTSNILLNNDGQLKIADFGLANFVSNKQPLTSRVVSLWYRPPELLLGSTKYGTYVDMWSVGCVFAELYIGKPILNGRTEVEQLHKIFMLCGTPSDDYWDKPTLPLAKMSKPRHAYESSIRERCKEIPGSAVNLIDMLLAVEPENRGNVTTALQSEYFKTRPYACDPASLPKYPPSKEIDIKLREEAHRKKAGGKLRGSASSRDLRRGQKTLLEQTKARRGAYFHGPRVSDDSKETFSDVSTAGTVRTLPALVTTSNGTLGWSTGRRKKRVSFATPTSQDVRSIDSFFHQDLSSSSSGQHHEVKLRFSGPMLIQPHRTNSRQDGYTRNGVSTSRFARDAEL